MGKEKEHRRHAHHPTATGEQDKEPQGQASSIKETWHPSAESRPDDPTQSEKRVIARQASHVSRSEKHKDIQDLERRMAQAALEETPGADNGEGLEKPEDFVGELAEKEMKHAKKIPYYLAEDDANKQAEAARERVDEAEACMTEIQAHIKDRSGGLHERMGQLAAEERRLLGAAAAALEATEKELAAAKQQRMHMEEERDTANDRESAYVYETEQIAKQVDNEYESALRAQELKVVERLSEEHSKKKQPSRQEVEREIRQEHDMLTGEKDALEAARKQVERAKMEQVYLAEELTRKLDRADYAIKEAEQKLERMRAEFERQLAAVRSEAAAARRDLERLRKDAERQEKSAHANLSSSKSHSDRRQAKPKGGQAKGAGSKSGGGAGSPAGGAYRTGKKAEGGSKGEQAKQDKPQIDEDELKFQEAVHFSEPTADPVVTGLDILDEDDRTPGLDPDKMGGQTAGAKSMEASVRAKEAQEQMAQEAEEAYKLRERTKPTAKGHGKHFATSTELDPGQVKKAAKQTAAESLEAAKEKAQKAKEVAQDPERAKQAAHETARQTAQKTKEAKETVKAKAQETAPGLTLASTNAPCVTSKAREVAHKANEAVEVSAQTVEDSLRGAAGAAKSAVDSILGRRPEE
ncbi:hypothetical protein COCSUDRAFT_46472 [Coccomyxa subellipsoidea C-169]|uniref:Uncharacterized protein n=1 Tax=Coccomyxa subellipsoidea (strain C-169) TaxID=574566 RepID=I0Z5Y2_COCSC|nr:hypothetical protein COCSUDRAFT_46472 [Coccomyxa subellipsoidea C-169]EIE26051.1 hypothetical protein COCSUDRAFT_46472 [Coccomyxa subellipsoidea C-169]|eukprot:XP_005650595.1 hypothetical protein COCSUDRAFT_46472 [Coccomyxa subellipsoidea C-169]